MPAGNRSGIIAVTSCCHAPQGTYTRVVLCSVSPSLPLFWLWICWASLECSNQSVDFLRGLLWVTSQTWQLWAEPSSWVRICRRENTQRDNWGSRQCWGSGDTCSTLYQGLPVTCCCSVHWKQGEPADVGAPSGLNSGLSTVNLEISILEAQKESESRRQLRNHQDWSRPER